MPYTEEVEDVRGRQHIVEQVGGRREWHSKKLESYADCVVANCMEIGVQTDIARGSVFQVGIGFSLSGSRPRRVPPHPRRVPASIPPRRRRVVAASSPHRT